MHVTLVKPTLGRTEHEDRFVVARQVRLACEELGPAFVKLGRLAREHDLRNDGRVADRFAGDFAGDPVVAVPRVVWRHTIRGVLAAAVRELLR